MTGTLQNKTMDKKTRIRRGEPITESELIFYPITMDCYDEFIRCKDAIILRQASLPVRYLSMSYLSALFAMEIDAIKNEQQSTGMFFKVMLMLHLSLRIGFDINELNKNISVKVDKDRIALDYIVIKQNDKIVKFTPLDFSTKFRPLIAEQNGLVLPDESENLDLVQSNETLKEIHDKGKPLNVNLDDLIASVAYQSKLSEKDIMTWTVREFENRKKAIDRDKRYMLCGQGEMSGMVSFKNGNPSPSWCFDTLDNSLGTMEGSKLQKTLSGVAEQKK
nr:MAG TPA: hypothetical protein [Caudoviricetes sp.]